MAKKRSPPAPSPSPVAVTGTRGEEPARSRKGAVRPPAKPHAEKLAHPGTQPLEQRHIEHESGYGGKKDEPRTSSDQREKLSDDGSLRSESK